MPYIRQDKRDTLDPVIDDLITTIRGLQSDDPADNTESNLNYVISRLLDKMYIADYREINNALGLLSAVSQEYYRRVAAPFENQKCHDNGDVYDLVSIETTLADYVDANQE